MIDRATSTSVPFTRNITPPHSRNCCIVVMSEVTRDTSAPRRSVWTCSTDRRKRWRKVETRSTDMPVDACRTSRTSPVRVITAPTTTMAKPIPTAVATPPMSTRSPAPT